MFEVRSIGQYSSTEDWEIVMLGLNRMGWDVAGGLLMSRPT